jgi:hypothetical protein
VRLVGVVAWNAGTTYAIGDIAVDAGVNYYAVKRATTTCRRMRPFWYAMPTDILELPTPFGNAGFTGASRQRASRLTSHARAAV